MVLIKCVSAGRAFQREFSREKGNFLKGRIIQEVTFLRSELFGDGKQFPRVGDFPGENFLRGNSPGVWDFLIFEGGVFREGIRSRGNFPPPDSNAYLQLSVFYLSKMINY